MSGPTRKGLAGMVEAAFGSRPPAVAPARTGAASPPGAYQTFPADRTAPPVIPTYDIGGSEHGQAFDAFNAMLPRAVDAVKRLRGTGMVAANGDAVGLDEIEDLLSKATFEIKAPGTQYRNGSKRGEADYNNGTPIIRLNGDVLDAYAKHGDAGLMYLILHELGHLTQAGRRYPWKTEAEAGEMRANDVARAIAYASGVPIMAPADSSSQEQERFRDIAYSSRTPHALKPMEQFPGYFRPGQPRSYRD